MEFKSKYKLLCCFFWKLIFYNEFILIYTNMYILKFKRDSALVLEIPWMSSLMSDLVLKLP